MTASSKADRAKRPSRKTAEDAGGQAAAPDLPDRLGHTFRNSALLRQALTHPSALETPMLPHSSYERLEFLGDRVLGLIVADMLIRRYPGAPEGELALRLNGLVRREACAVAAKKAALGPALIMSAAEEEDGGRDKPAILGDACEAVIGALYLDGGLDAARRFIERYWKFLMDTARTVPQDAKTALQEWAQGLGLALPVYVVLNQEGPAHDPRFTVEVDVPGRGAAKGAGRSKRVAEQNAAAALLKALGVWEEGAGEI